MATKEWVRFNDDSKARRNRERHVAVNGGEFVKGGNGWEWVNTKPVVKPAPPVVVKTTVQTTTTNKKKG